jgi:hypothetical protein
MPREDGGLVVIDASSPWQARSRGPRRHPSHCGGVACAQPLVALHTKASAPDPGSAERRRVLRACGQPTRPLRRKLPLSHSLSQTQPNPPGRAPTVSPLRAAFRAPQAVPIRPPVCLPCRRSRVRSLQPLRGQPRADGGFSGPPRAPRDRLLQRAPASRASAWSRYPGADHPAEVQEWGQPPARRRA